MVVIGLGIVLGARWYRSALVMVLASTVLASFAFAEWESSTESTRAYFSTFSRAWELGIGAGLALTAGWWARLPPRWQPVLSWCGLAGILSSVAFVSSRFTFPAPWALAPTLSTALVIAAGLQLFRPIPISADQPG